MLNKKEDSRVMSRWAEANKSRSVDISITRRPGSKGTKTNLSKKRTPPILSFWSAILDQRRFYHSLRYSIDSVASCISSPSLFYRVIPIAYFRYRALVCDEWLEKRARKGWSMLEGCEEGGKRMKRKRSTRKCRRNEQWQKGVRPDMGESSSSLRRRERSLFII